MICKTEISMAMTMAMFTAEIKISKLGDSSKLCKLDTNEFGFLTNFEPTSNPDTVKYSNINPTTVYKLLRLGFQGQHSHPLSEIRPGVLQIIKIWDFDG